ALRWEGSASSVRDIHPDDSFYNSVATAVSSRGDIVGYGNSHLNGEIHPILWKSTHLEHGIDLHPASGLFHRSFIFAMSDNQQVGYGYPNDTSFRSHALLWKSSADGVVDLHPASGFVYTLATGVAAGVQVGYGFNFALPGQGTHALMWSGSAAS